MEVLKPMEALTKRVELLVDLMHTSGCTPYQTRFFRFEFALRSPKPHFN
jgi:hypothetical protein